MSRRPFSNGNSHDRERLVALTIAAGHLQWGIQQLLSSKRWKMGKFIGNLWRRITLRQPVPLADEYIQDTLSRIDPLLQPTIPPPIPQRCPELSAFEDTPVDIVICVKDAEKYVRRCLRSLAHAVTNPGDWILVDDASGGSCQSALREFQVTQEDRTVKICRHKKNRGYTRSAKEGVDAASAPHVLLLNSDTELTPGCIPRLLRAMTLAGDRCAAVGPLSNAASWQSVPRLSQGKNWSTNPLPFGWAAADMAELVQQSGEPRHPDVPLLNGFCMLLNREIWTQLGGFDAESFPLGYGEEDDYCLRATERGYRLCIADDAFVYHAKTKSFLPGDRTRLVRKGSKQLRRLHGRRLEESVQAMKANSQLNGRRHEIQSAICRQTSDNNHTDDGLPRTMFVLPVSGGGGGAHSIVQEAGEMRHLGMPVQVAVPGIHRSKYLANYPEVDRSLFFFYRDEKQLLSVADEIDIAVATIFHSVELVQSLREQNPELATAYYVQDYEPNFFEWDSKPWQQARDSYELMSDMQLFAKTDWLCDVVEQHHSILVEKVQPGIDHDIFFPPIRDLRQTEVVKIAAMVRPSTPRRAPERTVAIMEQLHHDFDDRLEIHLFGATDAQLSELIDDRFPYQSHGILARYDVGQLLRTIHIFADYSDYQAFGRAALEAMACGCSVIVPQEGGCDEYARPEFNCLSVTSNDINDCLMTTRRMIVKRELREQLVGNGIATARRYTVRDAALSEIALLERLWQANGLKDASPVRT